MISCRMILAGFVSVSAVLAQSTGTVIGLLRDSVTNAPISGGNARLIGGGRTFVATAGADGRYRIDSVPEGKYKLDGYTTGYVGPSAAQDLDIHFTSGSFNADVTLDPLAVLRGRVLDDRGTPVEGSRVTVISDEMKTSYNAISGKDGSFLFKELSPSSAILFARPPKREQTAGDAEAPRIEMLTTYYPSAADAATSAEIHLIPGDRNSGYDINLIQQQVQRVRGVVRNSAGETVAGAPVYLQPALPNGPLRIRAWEDDADILSPPIGTSAAATTNAQGEFEFRSIPAGSWSLHSDGRSLAQMARQMKVPAESGQLQVDVSRSDIDHADITLEPPFDLIVNFEGAPNQLSVQSLLFEILTPSSPSFSFLTAKPEQLSNNSVVFHGISPGEYVVKPPSPPASYISVTVGGQEAIGRKVNLRPGTPVHITFSAVRTSIGGSVDRGNSDAGGVSVLLFPPQEADLEPVRYLSAGSGGDFKFEGLRPSTYSVIAVREPDVASLSDLTLRGLRSKARTVRLEAGAAETLTLTVQAIQ